MSTTNQQKIINKSRMFLLENIEEGLSPFWLIITNTPLADLSTEKRTTFHKCFSLQFTSTYEFKMYIEQY